jgi:hypothetical protein
MSKESRLDLLRAQQVHGGGWVELQRHSYSPAGKCRVFDKLRLSATRSATSGRRGTRRRAPSWRSRIPRQELRRLSSGRHRSFDTNRNYPLPNLFVGMLRRTGIESDKFASSNGTMRGLEMKG